MKKYHITYNKVLKEDKRKRDNDRISKKQQTKQKKWELINKEVGNCSSSGKEVELKQKQA